MGPDKIQIGFDGIQQSDCSSWDLKIGLKNKEMKTTVEYILLNRFNNASTLFFLCITDISIIYLKQVIELIETKKLPNDYLIKFIN
jgi:hypothetical protein